MVHYFVLFQAWTDWSPLWSEHPASAMSLPSPSHSGATTSWAAPLTWYLRRSWNLITSLLDGRRSKAEEVKTGCGEEMKGKKGIEGLIPFEISSTCTTQEKVWGREKGVIRQPRSLQCVKPVSVETQKKSSPSFCGHRHHWFGGDIEPRSGPRPWMKQRLL